MASINDTWNMKILETLYDNIVKGNGDFVYMSHLIRSPVAYGSADLVEFVLKICMTFTS